MQNRLTRPLSVILLSLLLAGCSVAEYRRMYFPMYQPAVTSSKIDASVAIETEASGFPDHNMGEAFLEVMTEDLSTLFQRPLLEQNSEAEFLLRTTVVYEGIFPPTSVEATVTLLEPSSGTKIVTFSRKVQDSTFLGETRTRQVAEKFVRIALPGIKEELLRALNSATSVTRRAPLQPFPGLQGDR